MRDALPRLPVSCRLIALDSIGSTNDYAKMLAREGAAEGTVVWAREQTAGRGRRGNAWASISGNLFMTIILYPKTSAALCGQLSFLAAVALARTIRPLLPDGKDVALKWPNDLLIDGKKIAGILLEAEPNGLYPLEWLVVGIGVNIVDAPEGAASLQDFAPLLPPAERERGSMAEEILENLVNAIVLLYEEWRINGFAAVRAEWLAQAASLDETITVRLPKSSSSGIFRGIDENGALLLDLPDGGRTIITSGEVFTG